MQKKYVRQQMDSEFLFTSSFQRETVISSQQKLVVVVHHHLHPYLLWGRAHSSSVLMCVTSLGEALFTTISIHLRAPVQSAGLILGADRRSVCPTCLSSYQTIAV